MIHNCIVCIYMGGSTVPVNDKIEFTCHMCVEDGCFEEFDKPTRIVYDMDRDTCQVGEVFIPSRGCLNFLFHPNLSEEIEYEK